MAAAGDEWLSFREMSEAELRQWVEANPGRVNHRDSRGSMPLFSAACRKEGLSLVVWLLDEKGADVNGALSNGYTPLQCAASPSTFSRGRLWRVATSHV